MYKNRISGMAMVRVDLGITQQQLADTLGISRALVGMAERGTRRLPKRAMDYLHSLRRVAEQNPPTVVISRRKRPSVATRRPAYNRIPFSSRREKIAGSHIATLNNFKSVLSEAELRMVGENLKEYMLKTGKKQPEAADACRQLLLMLEQKEAFTLCRVKMLELEKEAAPAKAREIKESLVVITARLKAYRQAYREHPGLRKGFRKKIAGLYLKKLTASGQLEKFNRPAMQRKKQEIAELKEFLDRVRKLSGQIEQRINHLSNVLY